MSCLSLCFGPKVIVGIHSTWWHLWCYSQLLHALSICALPDIFFVKDSLIWIMMEICVRALLCLAVLCLATIYGKAFVDFVNCRAVLFGKEKCMKNFWAKFLYLVRDKCLCPRLSCCCKLNLAQRNCFTCFLILENQHLVTQLVYLSLLCYYVHNKHSWL